jgi:hypothetical protein
VARLRSRGAAQAIAPLSVFARKSVPTFRDAL